MILQLAALLGIVAIVYRREHRAYRRHQARADVIRRNRPRLP